MKRISITILPTLLIILVLFGLNFNYKNDLTINKWAPQNDVARTPIVFDFKNHKNVIYCSSPKEQRDEQYKKFLASSVKIVANNAGGSGTIIYYNAKENWAYVISCGHLFSGNKNYNPNLKEKAKIITWYKNNKKLEEPVKYEAEVLFWSNERGYDCSLLRFKPDYEPNYFPIAQVNFNYSKKMILNSLGCDGGKEVARYEVEFVEIRELDLVTAKNSPRPGRSGGGLLTDSKLLVGICWGTSDKTSGNGFGYFTPLSSIHKVLTKNKHEWLLKIIKVYNWDKNQEEYDLDLIPMPLSYPNTKGIRFSGEIKSISF